MKNSKQQAEFIKEKWFTCIHDYKWTSDACLDIHVYIKLGENKQ